MIVRAKLVAISVGLVLAGLSTAPLVSATYTVQANGTTQSVATFRQGSTVYVPLQDAAQLAHATVRVNAKTRGHSSHRSSEGHPLQVIGGSRRRSHGPQE